MNKKGKNNIKKCIKINFGVDFKKLNKHKHKMWDIASDNSGTDLCGEENDIKYGTAEKVISTNEFISDIDDDCVAFCCDINGIEVYIQVPYLEIIKIYITIKKEIGDLKIKEVLK